MALIPPVSAAGTPPIHTPAVAPTSPSTNDAGGSGFGDAIASVLENLGAAESRTDGMAQAAATGRLQNVEDYMIAATETQLAMQLTVAVRNRAVEAFNDIMRMQV
jgi:flagellar hook-basal body complex protein FliE